MNTADCHTQLADRCERLGAQILAADPADREGLVGPGTDLEALLTDAADAPRPVRDLLARMLDTLQALYEQRLPDSASALAALATAAIAAATALRDPAECDATPNALTVAADALQEADGATATDGPDAAAPATASPVQGSIEAPLPPDRPGDSANTGETPMPPPAEAPSPTALPATFLIPPETDPDMLHEFAVECLDHIRSAEASLLELESDPNLPEPINVVFRAFHTIKGTSGFLGLEILQHLAHLAENLLDRAREGKIHIRGGYADLALESCDSLRTMIESLRTAAPGTAAPIPPATAGLLDRLRDPEAAGVSEDADVEPLRVGDILVAQGAADRATVEAAAQSAGRKRIGEALVDDRAAAPADVARALRTQNRQGAPAGDATIRVATDRLDSLINMVGELVIAQSMVAQDPDVSGGGRPRLQRNVAHAGKIIRALQDLTMSLRMVPLKATFQKMARLVRDLARNTGKSVTLVTEGEDTEIDRNMVEALNDPLIHMMRNALDHGVESAADRTAAGKDPTGTVRLRAYHSAGNVVLVLQDDGKGLDRDRILAKAVDRGLVEPGRDLPDSEIFALIFHPGFSTAETVTDLSGRGVGMDVVKRGIESLRGRVEVDSRKGRGTTFTIRLPLTMAITDGMLVRVGEQRYLLPTVSIERSFQPQPEAISTVKGRGEMVLVRGELLPLFRLHRLFTVPAAVTDPCQGLLVLIEGEGKRCALMVDELLGQQQVVVKSLGATIGQVRGVSGGAILGDGRVGLILDPAGLLALVDASEPHTHRPAA